VWVRNEAASEGAELFQALFQNRELVIDDLRDPTDLICKAPTPSWRPVMNWDAVELGVTHHGLAYVAELSEFLDGAFE